MRNEKITFDQWELRLQERRAKLANRLWIAYFSSAIAAFIYINFWWVL